MSYNTLESRKGFSCPYCVDRGEDNYAPGRAVNDFNDDHTVRCSECEHEYRAVKYYSHSGGEVMHFSWKIN